jgi:frataxin-like iron-binding protein CyaY
MRVDKDMEETQVIGIGFRTITLVVINRRSNKHSPKTDSKEGGKHFKDQVFQ